MKKLAVSSALLGGIVAAMLSVAPASAQATRTWVSGVGDDANPCSRTAPCKTFAGAISKTAGGGEINVLDPGGFGGVTITKSITISSTFEAGVLVSGTNAIVISAGLADSVVLQGLDIEGLGTGLSGVVFNSGLKVNIINCKIHQFTTAAVTMNSSTPGAHLFIDDSYIIKNANGVNVTGTNNIASLTNVRLMANNNAGNTGFAVQANGTGVIIGVQQSTLNDSPTSISRPVGQVISVGTTNLVTGAGTFSSVQNFQ
jgi:hypothetical protein